MQFAECLYLQEVWSTSCEFCRSNSAENLLLYIYIGPLGSFILISVQCIQGIKAGSLMTLGVSGVGVSSPNTKKKNNKNQKLLSLSVFKLILNDVDVDALV